MKTKLFKLAKNDFIKGAFMVLLVSVATAIYESVKAGIIPTDISFYVASIKAGLGLAILYLLKNFVTNNNDKILKKDVIVKIDE